MAPALCLFPVARSFMEVCFLERSPLCHDVQFPAWILYILLNCCVGRRHGGSQRLSLALPAADLEPKAVLCATSPSFIFLIHLSMSI